MIHRVTEAEPANSCAHCHLTLSGAISHSLTVKQNQCWGIFLSALFSKEKYLWPLCKALLHTTHKYSWAWYLAHLELHCNWKRILPIDILNSIATETLLRFVTGGEKKTWNESLLSKAKTRRQTFFQKKRVSTLPARVLVFGGCSNTICVKTTRLTPWLAACILACLLLGHDRLSMVTTLWIIKSHQCPGSPLIGGNFNFEQNKPLNLKGQCVKGGYVGCLEGEETWLSHPSARAQAEQWRNYCFQTLHIYLDHYGERSRRRRTESINNAFTVILRHATVCLLLWLITISNATLHYCKKGCSKSGSVEPQKKKVF